MAVGTHHPHFIDKGPETLRGEVTVHHHLESGSAQFVLRSVAELGTMSLSFGKVPQMEVALVAPGTLWCLAYAWWSTFTHVILTTSREGCCTRNLLAALEQPLPSLFAEGSLDGYVHGARSTGKTDRAWTGVETQSARQDQGNWLGQLSQAVVMLVCPFPQHPRNSLPFCLGKGRKLLEITTRQLLPFLECLLCASYCIKSLHGLL